jgi:hypothetical protein
MSPQNLTITSRKMRKMTTTMIKEDNKYHVDGDLAITPHPPQTHV